MKEENIAEASTEEEKKQGQIMGKSVVVESSTEQRKKYSSPEAKEKKEHIKQGKGAVAVESTDQGKKYGNPVEKEKQKQIKKEKSVVEESTVQRKKNSNSEEKEKQEQTKKGKGVAVKITEQRILRPRCATTEDKQKNTVSTSPLKVAHEKAYRKNNFSLTLTKKEIEEDFLAMTGQKPPQKPTKRPKAVKKHMDELLGQGKTLRAIMRAKTYKVKEETSNKGKSFKQRFDEYIRSAEYEM